MISRAFGEGRVRSQEEEEERDTAFMDWDLKTPSWDFLDFDRESGPNIASLVGSNCIGEQKPRGDCSVDLKLGRLGDLGDGALNKWKDPRDSSVLSSSSSPLSSAKRPRTPATGMQVVSCLVDGCTADLSRCRDYHRRHKVCEAHSKTPRVMVGGQEQRFCQQCSRFHMLGEFDEVKRSCRKRLDGHNRRRRKPQPDMNSGNLFSHHQGTRLLPFANPQVRPSTNVINSNWKAVVKTEEDMLQYNGHPPLHLVDRQPQFSGSFSGSYKREKQFPFLPPNNHVLGHQTVAEASVCQPLLNTISCSSQNGSGASRKMFSDGLSRVLDSDCALSLLSSPPTQSSGINMSHLGQSDSIPIAQSLVPGLQYTSLCGYPSEGIESEQMGTVLVSDANDSEIHCHGIYNVGPGSSQNGVQQRLPFSWE